MLAALQTQGRRALQLNGGSDEVVQQEQTNATRSDYVVKGTIRRRRHRRIGVGGPKQHSISSDGGAPQKGGARGASPCAREAFLTKRPRLHERGLETREDGRSARYKTGRARVRAPLYAVRVDVRRAELPHDAAGGRVQQPHDVPRVRVRDCPSYDEAGHGPEPLKAVFRQDCACAPLLAPRTRGSGKMPLDDACLSQYLAAAKWSLDFPDRPVVDAIGATAAWRPSTVAARANPGFVTLTGAGVAALLLECWREDKAERSGSRPAREARGGRSRYHIS